MMDCGRFLSARRIASRSPRKIVALAAALLFAPISPHTPAKAGPAPSPGLKDAVRTLIAIQEPDGQVPSSPLLDRYPLLATLGWHAYQVDGDVALLKDACTAASRYLAYLLATYDGDGDFLLERTCSPSHVEGGLEGPGYNALLALDLGNLARMYAELNRPLEALYWYQGMKTIARRVVATTYDGHSGFFFPYDDTLDHTTHVFLALSPVAASFRFELGDNLSRGVILNYLLPSESLQPETPAHYIDTAATGNRVASEGVSETAIRAAVLLSVLQTNDMAVEASTRAPSIRRVIMASRTEAASSAPDATALLELACAALDTGGRELFPGTLDVQVLRALSLLSDVMESKDRGRLAASSLAVERFLADEGTAQPAEITAVEQHVREVYWAISEMREKWRKRSLFAQRDRDRIPGFDVYASAADLFDETIRTLRRAETRLAVIAGRARGLEFSATLANEFATPGDPISLRLAVRTLSEPVDIEALVMLTATRADTLVNPRRPLRVKPGDAPVEYQYRHAGGTAPGLVPISLAAEFQFGDGNRVRYQIERGAWLSPPLSFTVHFPQGRSLAGSEVPVELAIRKHTERPVELAAEWYSPSGLSLREGRSLQMTVPAGQRQMTIPMHVTVPASCRPGGFPFVFKVFANGQDVGLARDGFFRHYQWVYIGPFAAARGLDTTHPPERRINLGNSFAGAIRKVFWVPLPKRTLRDGGWIDLTPLLPQTTTGYLYTAIRSPAALRTGLTLACSGPVMVFVNGSSVARFDASTERNPQRVPVDLEEGVNNVLVKMVSGGDKRIFVQVGDPDGLTPDAFGNNLAELVDGYQQLYARNGESRDAARNAHRVVTLTYRNPEAQSVSVIGTFNAWSPENTTMRGLGNGRWEINLHLAPGRYAYRFLVDQRTQVLDPVGKAREPDGFGGENSVLLVE